MAATIPADLLQFFGYSLRLAQEISYIYGFKDLMGENGELSEEAKNNYDKFVLFVKGEYEGDADSLLAATEDTEAVATVTLDEQTAKSVAETVEKDYYDILKDGTESYEADGTEKYQSTELNMMDQKLKKLFSIDSSQEATEATDVTAAILADVPQEDKQTLYKETMKYLAGLYGENTDSSEESAAE